MSRTNAERRAFLAQAGRAGLFLAGGLGLGLGLSGSDPPNPHQGPKPLQGLPDFAMPGMSPRLAVAQGPDRVKNLTQALDRLGGLKAFIKPKERVLIKVNAAFASPPLLGATTHPDLLAALIAQCRQAGAGQVLVTDNPIQDPATCFQLSGLAGACRTGGAELVLPRPEGFAPFSLPQGRLLVNWPVLAGPLAGVDRVIGLAPVKDHHRSGASLSMKNWYGLLGGRRNVFHQDIHGIITELARMMRPSLVILDGTVSMISNGPTGGSLDDLKPTQTLIASTDQVAADARASALLNKTPADLPFLALAQKAGVGTTDWQALVRG